MVSLQIERLSVRPERVEGLREFSDGLAPKRLAPRALSGEKIILTFGHPHLVLFTPRIIRLPDLEADRIFPAGLRNECSFSGMRYIDASHHENFFGYPFIDEDPIALPHRCPIFSPPLHGQKLPLVIPAGKHELQVKF